jgi:hypothetical protein
VFKVCGKAFKYNAVAKRPIQSSWIEMPVNQFSGVPMYACMRACVCVSVRGGMCMLVLVHVDV